MERFLTALQDLKAALGSERGTSGVPTVDPQDANNAHSALTPREAEVSKLIAVGKSSKQVAVELGIAFRTAVCHRYRLYRKLDVHTNVELARAATRMGLVEL